MKIMKNSELRSITTEELEKRIIDSRKELFNLKFQHAMSQLDNIMRLSQVKKSIARMLTILRERRSIYE